MPNHAESPSSSLSARPSSSTHKAIHWLHAVKCHKPSFPPPRHSNPLWPLHVWLRKTISSDIIDVTDVIVIKLLACEGPLCLRAVWWIIVKVIACWCFMEGLYVNAQVIASRVGWPARQVPRTLTHKPSGWRFLISREKKSGGGVTFLITQLYLSYLHLSSAYGKQTSEINSPQFWK